MPSIEHLFVSLSLVLVRVDSLYAAAAQLSPVAYTDEIGTVEPMKGNEHQEAARPSAMRDARVTDDGMAAVTGSLRAFGKADPLAALMLLISSLPPMETSRDVYKAG